MDKLKTAERYEWYIINALMFKVSQSKKVIKEARESMTPEAPKMLVANMEGMIEHLEQSIKEHQEALDALKEAGFK